MTAIDAQHAEEVHAIKALIQAFFDAINAEDIKGLQAKFLPKANLTIIRQDPPLPHGDHLAAAGGGGGEGGGADDSTTNTAAAAAEEKDKDKENLTVVIRTPIETFIKLLEDSQRRRRGRPGPALRETPDLAAAEVRVDGLFGAAWCPFEVTFDGVLHHYGTMVYTLGRVAAVEGAAGEGVGGREWRVEGLTQNYRRTPGWAAAAAAGGEEGEGGEGLF